MSKKISHSAWEKYVTCPKMYDIHYNERLRPTGTTSALIFGSAMDSALNYLLLTGNLEQSIEIFRNAFTWEDCKTLIWDDRDLDLTILENGDKLPKNNHTAWMSMRVKGRLFLEKYYYEFYPKIERVESVQQKLNGRPGFIDAIVRLRDHGRILLDHKTSARPYSDNAIADSTQLALYANDQGISKVGFVVFNKEIQKNTTKICKLCKFNGSYTQHKTCPQIVNGKRCHGVWVKTHKPEAIIQFMVADIPAINGKLINESLCEVEKAIEQSIFPRNLKACGKIYGKPCPYLNYCWKGDKSNLVHIPEEREKDDQKTGK